MYEWFQINEDAVLAAFYGFMVGFLAGMTFFFFEARSIVRKKLHRP